MLQYFKHICALGLLTVASAATLAQQNPKPVDTQPVTSTHIIGAAKLIIGDVKQNQAYYEQFFGMKEVSHYSAKDVYDEPIMGFSEGARLALFHPLAEPLAKKSQFPVALIYTPDFETLVKKMEDAKQPVTRLPVAQSGTFKIAI